MNARYLTEDDVSRLVTMQVAIDAVREAIGKRPNTVVMGPKVWSALKQHPAII